MGTDKYAVMPNEQANSLCLGSLYDIWKNVSKAFGVAEKKGTTKTNETPSASKTDNDWDDSDTGDDDDDDDSSDSDKVERSRK